MAGQPPFRRTRRGQPPQESLNQYFERRLGQEKARELFAALQQLDDVERTRAPAGHSDFEARRLDILATAEELHGWLERTTQHQVQVEHYLSRIATALEHLERSYTKAHNPEDTRSADKQFGDLVREQMAQTADLEGNLALGARIVELILRIYSHFS